MIFLLKDTVNGDTISLSKQKEYIVGRKNCDILLENDQSISRKHAIIRVKDDHVTLEDCKSKYHTLRNGVEVNPEVKIRLEHMDLIQFGVFNSKFSFEAFRFITAASALSAEKKAALKENIVKCKGKYVEKWSSSCTHLTVDKITLTIKVLQALIDEKPIVTPEYWLKYAESIQNKTTPPDINKYNTPPVAEQLLKSDFQYKLDSKRKTLFENKMFVFLKSSTKKQMEEVIKSCGGDCMAWEEGPKTFNEMSISRKEYLIVKTDNDAEHVSFNAVLTDMVKKNKRAIALNEIALAIVHCSCEINCNPDFNKVTKVFGSHTQKQQTMSILAVETQTENVSAREIKTEKVIAPSVEDDWELSILDTKENHKKTAGPSGVKRPSSDDDNSGIFKKPKSEQEENKRKEKEKVTRLDNIAAAAQNTSRSKSEDNYKNKPLPTQKRKAEEDLQKSNSKKLNPFSLITVAKNKKNESSDDDNPFELTRGSNRSFLRSRSPPANYENPFSRLRTLRKTSRTSTIDDEEMLKPKQEPRKEIRMVPSKNNTSFMTSVKTSLLNTTWMSKSTSIVKQEVKEEDTELLQIVEAFKNCVKVKILPVFNKQGSKENLNDTSSDSIDGKKSFKKFRKVKPVKPQVTIIPRSHFTKVGPGDLTGIHVDFHDSEDEADHNKSSSKQKVKQVKKFVL